MRVRGTVDELVPVKDAGLTWTAGPRPTPDWPAGRFLVVYDRLGHSVAGAAGSALLGDVIGFFTANLPP